MAHRSRESVLSCRSAFAWALIGALAVLVALPAGAQAPAGRPVERNHSVPGGVPDRLLTIDSQGLNSPALRLSRAQRAQIDKVIDAYLNELGRLNERYPTTQHGQPSQEAAAARITAQNDLTAALGKVLTDDQRNTWESVRAARNLKSGPAQR